MPTAAEIEDKRVIRELVENWAVWRDALMWDRFRTVWHDDGRMMATWFQGTADEFIKVSQEGYERGVRILHFLGGTSIDVAADRAVAQTKMTISQRARVENVLCDVVCTGRFYDFFEKRDGRWGLVLRQPIYEKDRLDPVDPWPRARTRSGPAGAVSRGLPASRLPADPDRLQGEDRHARPRRARGRSALPPRRRLARGRGAGVKTRGGREVLGNNPMQSRNSLLGCWIEVSKYRIATHFRQRAMAQGHRDHRLTNRKVSVMSPNRLRPGPDSAEYRANLVAMNWHRPA